MDSRRQILNKLRNAQKPFEDIPERNTKYHVVPKHKQNTDALLAQFIDETTKLGCYIYQPQNESDALEQLLDLIGEDKRILAWDTSHIPLSQLPDWLSDRNIQVAASQDAGVRLGLTGIDAALAATGSLVLCSGEGKARSASLLPPVHVAILQQNQILADLETWFATQRDDNLQQFRQIANITVISGPSKTADIAQELVKGAHGPKEVHILILNNDTN